MFLHQPPIGAITLLVIAIYFPDPDRTAVTHHGESWLQRIKYFDPIGTALFMPAVICLLLALQWGGTTYAWDSGRIIALFVLFGVADPGLPVRAVQRCRTTPRCRRAS